MLVQEPCIFGSGADFQCADQAGETAVGQGIEDECDRRRCERFVENEEREFRGLRFEDL